jgi:hypothetical protein
MLTSPCFKSVSDDKNQQSFNLRDLVFQSTPT